ncbi:MAG: hypothetical protein ACLP0J_22300 [Solirubrobacteraceae bacterium]
MLRVVRWKEAMANPKGNDVLVALAASRSVLGVLLGARCAVVLAACGSTRSTGYHNQHYPYGAPNAPISMSKCMRANGVSNFPDPREGPNGGGVGWPGGGPVMISSDVPLIMGQQFAGPVVASAAKTCEEYMAPSGPPPVVSESERVAAIANAECMRKLRRVGKSSGLIAAESPRAATRRAPRVAPASSSTQQRTRDMKSV